MDAVQTGGGHLVSGAASADFTYAEYWRTLMATAEHTGQTLHAEGSHEPVPSLESPTPTPPPPSRRVPPGRWNNAAATVAPRAPPSHLTEAGTYRLNLALTPSPHQAKRLPLPQHQEPLHTTTMSNHVGEGERGEWIARAMRAGKEASAPAEQSIRKPSSARKSPPPAERARSRVSPPSALDTAAHLSGEDAGAARATDSMREQWARATVIGGTRPVGSTVGDQRDSCAPSGDKDLVDSPRQHSFAAGSTSAQHAFSLTSGAAAVDAVCAYTPDDLVVKAAQCYEQWRRCVMDGSIDTDDGDDSVRECRFSGEDSSMARGGEAADAVHRIIPPDGRAREGAESHGAAAPNYTPSALSRTPTSDRRGALDPDRSKVRLDGKSLLSPACARGKQTPSRAEGTQSRIHSAETTTHGLTSGRRDRDGDTDSTITAAVALASLFTWKDASPAAKSPSPHVALAAPTVFRSISALDEKVAEHLTVEDEVETTVEEQGARSHGALRPSQQERHKHPLIQARHCLHQRVERTPEMATSAARPESAHRTYMSKDVRRVHEASGSLQSSSVAEADVDDAHNAAPLSFVYRRLFADEVEDWGGGVTMWRDVADARHRERGGATNAGGALSLFKPSSGKEGQKRLPAGARDVLAERQSEVTMMVSSDAAHSLATLAEVDHVRETLIELSSSCSSVEDHSDPVGGAELNEDEIASHTEANLHQGASNSSHGAPSLNGNRSNLSLSSASRLSLPSSAWPVDKGKRNGPDQAEMTDSEAQVPPAVAARPLLCRDHPLWCKHHASVSMLYASRLLPSEQANDELQLFLCWAQEKAERQSRWRQHHHNGDTGGSSETVLGTSELGACPHLSCAVAEVYKVAYSVARRGKGAGAPLSRVQRDNASGNSEPDAAVGALPVGFAPAQAASPSRHQMPPLPHPIVFVAAPLQSSEAASSSTPPEDVDWTVTPSAAPSRFVEWIATEVDPYESLLFSPL
ncbi:conserved hypothetical protein [Leishmania major strain Friedlin]|uniref:Uncharacterized protein n=1 Tax=Leishmania major TaxID=5664 RepID=Q4QD84_LEIMA|nr:conserved hypothetical protein [Leishmania major strain Friedlin]CAG9572836.1 hypothetical_protein_-_conserved [Leishmania major strain Friedlin]CAJ07222.1 conserved hypothetical protein [Leishmania major strain Friedlin]|eukprot:XP_001682714.1 conserved hypothetical protein [Leishmania major strain Friedlin]